MLRKLFAAVAIAAVLAGCGKHHINDDIVDDASSTLEVVNHHWGDVDIFAVRNGQRTRIGQVTATGNESFVLDRSMTSGGGTLQFQAHAVGMNGAINSETINVRPGGMQLTWTLENNLARATLAYY